MTDTAWMRAPSPPLGRQVAIASGKGGVGKTFVSVNLAYALALGGARVVVFDGDVGLANVDVQLGLSPARDLADVISGSVALEDAVTPVGGGSTQKGGFDVLAGRSGSGALGGLAGEAIARLEAGLATVALSYDYVVLDLGAGVEPATLRLAGGADEALIVVQDEPTSITDAYAFIKQMRQRRPHSKPRLVVNAAKSPEAAARASGGLVKTCAQFLDFSPEVLGVIVADTHVPEAVRRQSLLGRLAPDAPAWTSVRALADALRAPTSQPKAPSI